MNDPGSPRRDPASVLAQLWQLGQRPDVGEVLRQSPNPTRAQIVAALCFDQWQRWHTGERVPAEAHLKMHPAIQEGEEGFDLVFGEFLLREELGEHPSLFEYLERFPQYSEQLRRQVELHEMIGSESPSIIAEGARTMTNAIAAAEEAGVPQEPGWPAVGGYEILGELGKGGMGTVYKARHKRLGRLVALKVIRPERLTDQPQAIDRFVREAQAAARLNHPNIVVVYDCDQMDNTYFIAMEYVEGIDLYHLVKESGPLAIEEACDYICQAAQGLQHAFEQGMVHRDIKPNNLLVTTTRSATSKVSVMPATGSDLKPPAYAPLGLSSLGTARPGVVKILDMGLALVPAEGGVSHWTMEGTLMGTPDYIAPEQALNCHAVDIRADLYSLGCTFYFLLTGKPPFADHHLLQKLMMHQAMPPKPVESLRPEVPVAVSAVVHKLLEKRLEDRFQVPAEVVQVLSSLDGDMKMPGTVMLSNSSLPAGKPSVPSKPSLPLREKAEPPKSILPWRTPQAEESLSQSILPVRDKAAETPQSILPWRDKPMELPAPSTPPPQREPTPPPMASQPAPPPAAVPAKPAAPPRQAEKDEDARRQARKIAVLEGHRGWVTAVTFSPNRSFLTSGGVDGTLRFWDLAGTEPEDRAIPNAHASDIGALAFSPDSKVLASGAGTLDGLIWLWNLPASNQARTYIQANKATIDALAFSVDGNVLAGGGSDKLIRLWDVSGEPRAMTSMKGHGDFVTLITFSPDGKSLASASRDETVRLWNPNKLWSKETGVLEGAWGQVFALAFSPDGTELAFGGLDQSIYVWDLADGRPRARAVLKGHEGVVRLIHFTSDRRSIVSVCDAGKVIFWEADTKAIRVEWQLPRARACSIACTHDGRYLATGNSDGSVSLFRLHDSLRSGTAQAQK